MLTLIHTVEARYLDRDPLLTTSAWKEKLHVEHGNDLVMLDKTQNKDRWQDETYYKKWSCNPMVDWIKYTSGVDGWT